LLLPFTLPLLCPPFVLLKHVLYLPFHILQVRV
jgi:hypothetical protein